MNATYLKVIYVTQWTVEGLSYVYRSDEEPTNSGARYEPD
jgi:hypothetical protein